MPLSSPSLREEFLKLLEEDKGVRYAVAAYLGFSELLNRMDTLAEGQAKIWEELRGLK